MPKDILKNLSSLNVLNPDQFTLVWLTWSRLGLVIAVLFLSLKSELSFDYWLILCGYVGATFWFVYQREVLEQSRNLALGLTVDIAFIGWFLYTQNGVMSGWVSVLLFPALVGSLTCAKRTAWFIACLAMICYGALIYVHLAEMETGAHVGHSMDHMSHMNHDQEAPMSMASHIEGMLITFCISVGILTGFISHQADLLRRHQRSLVEMHERQLREQQIMAFATLSANTTHRLASPISSISLLLEELAENHPDIDWQSDDVYNEINIQITRCSSVLQALVKTTRDYDPNKQRRDNIDTWLPEVIGNWWVTRNEVHYQLDIDRALEGQEIEYDDNISFALVNLLDNAANACKSQSHPLIVLNVSHHRKDKVQITLQDNGEGIKDLYIPRFGKQFIKSQSGGMGIGTALAQAAIQQAGGAMTVAEGDEIDGVKMGTKVMILLPLTAPEKQTG